MKSEMRSLAFLAALSMGSAFAGNSSVLVVTPDDVAGVIPVQIESSVAEKVKDSLKKGAAPVIDTSAGTVIVKGQTSKNEFIGVRIPEEQQEPN